MTAATKSVVRACLALVLGFAAGCAGPRAEVRALREMPVLGYSVWVTGGAFVPAASVASLTDPMARTFDVGERGAGDEAAGGEPPVIEAVPLAAFEELLRAAEVFVRLDVDARPAESRRRSSSELDPQLLLQVREAGHDLVLVVRGIDDGAIEDQGINDLWPVTLLTWLGLGLGMVIPDRTFESRAALDIALVDAWSGRELVRESFGAGPVDLALVERGNLLGIVLSIIVPPFWVGSDEDRVDRRVRSASTRRLAVGVARRLKRPSTEAAVRTARPVDFEVRTLDDGRSGVRVACTSAAALSFVRVRQDGEAPDPVAFARFERALLASRRPADVRPGADERRGFRYEADWLASDGYTDPRLLQILGQTIAGGVGSETFALGGPR